MEQAESKRFPFWKKSGVFFWVVFDVFSGVVFFGTVFGAFLVSGFWFLAGC